MWGLALLNLPLPPCLLHPCPPPSSSLSLSQYFTSLLVCSILDERMIWQMLMKHSTQFTPLPLFQRSSPPLRYPPPPHLLLSVQGQWGCPTCPSMATVIKECYFSWAVIRDGGSAVNRMATFRLLFLLSSYLYVHKCDLQMDWNYRKFRTRHKKKIKRNKK